MEHTADPVCLGCEKRLEWAHPYLQDWFRAHIKPQYPNTHVSWSFRGQEDQNAFYRDGKTKLIWPNSAHNHMENGAPLSLALDLFQIDEDGVARWAPLFFAKLNAYNEAQGLKIFWGGRWKTLGDGDHFSYIPPMKAPEKIS